ncbi:ABC transporter ATP-binding protein [Pelagibacterium limicola]|uniref:ABC transporter ATP-binding protein n=1 Tax=Pelagibacterium limicola TaxID=2791022 RepID=UPI0018AFC8D0|nr:ABC transporter ATP-binding protein [Pelagibacterium limicola]
MEPSILINQLTLNYGPVEVLKKLDLDVPKGEFLVLLGSSGCGKSTLLNCIAGLLEPTDGQIHINGRNVTWEEPSRRGIGMVFQSYALYPQMTVEKNLTFGLKNAKVPRNEIAERVARAAGILQIEPLLKRRPSALSGGQRQRVAIGRALVRDVDVFLFDEPLSNLDAKLRAELRVEIKRLHQNLGNTMIYVTHDQVEAMTLADRIAIMRGGEIMQLASPSEIYNLPVNKYVASFIGSPSMNFFEAVLGQGEIKLKELSFPQQDYQWSSEQRSGQVWFGVRPEHVVSGDALGKCKTQFDVVVDMVEPMGSETLVWAKLAGEPFRFRLDGQTRIVKGDTVRVGFDLSLASMFDAQTERRI